jgi:3-hydroxyisobutyrate dehydrogenase-like beta-hydroxyacid dehydrogenase
MVESTQNIAQFAISSGKYGWIGLGAMGKFMAGHVQAYCTKYNMPPLKVWNRTTARSHEHSEKYQSCTVEDLK